jgi:hypothetical protein
LFTFFLALLPVVLGKVKWKAETITVSTIGCKSWYLVQVSKAIGPVPVAAYPLQEYLPSSRLLLSLAAMAITLKYLNWYTGFTIVGSDLNLISAITIPRFQSANRLIKPPKSIEVEKSTGESSNWDPWSWVRTCLRRGEDWYVFPLNVLIVDWKR